MRQKRALPEPCQHHYLELSDSRILVLKWTKTVGHDEDTKGVIQKSDHPVTGEQKEVSSRARLAGPVRLCGVVTLPHTRRHCLPKLPCEWCALEL